MRKNIFLRALYDFANSIVMIVFLFYFSQRLVVERWVSEMRYNGSLIMSSILFILIAPFISKKTDQGASKIRWLRVYTILAFLLFGAVGLLTRFMPQHTLVATILYAVSMTVYLICFLYYTPMLNDLATQWDHAKISWRGQWVSSFGFVLWLIIMIPVASWSLWFLGTGRTAPLLLAPMLFFVCALPMLLWYNAKDHPASPKEVAKQSIWKTLQHLISHKAVFLFLIAYFFYSDALLTFSSNYPLFLEKVHAIWDTQKSILTAVILLFASLSAFFTGWWADRVGLKKSLLWLLWAWCFVFPTFSFISWFRTLAVMSCIAGILYWPTWSVSRALFSKILPKHLTATWFSFFIICERFSTLVWPLLRWALVTWLWWWVLWYKVALVSMSILVFTWRVINKKV